MSLSYSIIICTHNPDLNLFSRLLNAIQRIQETNPIAEILIVDNNSNTPIKSDASLSPKLKTITSIKIIEETTPGLTAARIAGIKAAQNEWVVFFDDDNEPASDYLLQAASIIHAHPELGILGPGQIEVDFVGHVGEFAREHKDLFQERKMEEMIIDNVRWDQPAYPYGTGMIVKRTILLEYCRQIESGNYTMSDRIGKSLISGGDIQILLTGIRMGFYGGSSPDLKLTHMIHESKTRFKKILQLVYMLSASAIKSYNEVFPEEPHQVVKISNAYVLRTIYSQLRMHLFKKTSEK